MRIDYQRLVHHIYHHYISIIVVATALSIFSGFFALKLAKNIKTDFADLLPNDYDSVSELNRIKARVGGIGPLMVVITSEDMDKAVDFMLVLAAPSQEGFLSTALSLPQGRASPEASARPRGTSRRCARPELPRSS